MNKQPSWWSNEHTSAWDRVKSAMKRDWEQTKSDLSMHKKGTDIDQGVGDTVKQMAGKEPVPPATMKNPPDMKDTKGMKDSKSSKDHDWNDVEDDYRFGVGARRQYGGTWNTGVESSLAKDWGELNRDRSWDEVKPRVRRAWEIDPDKSK